MQLETHACQQIYFVTHGKICITDLLSALLLHFMVFWRFFFHAIYSNCPVRIFLHVMKHPVHFGEPTRSPHFKNITTSYRFQASHHTKHPRLAPLDFLIVRRCLKKNTKQSGYLRFVTRACAASAERARSQTGLVTLFLFFPVTAP